MLTAFRGCARLKSFGQFKSQISNVSPTRRFGALAGKYSEEMYKKWCENPKQVHPSWDVYFQNNVAATTTSDRPSLANASTSALFFLIRAHQVRGHQHANLDPLNLTPKPDIPELDYKTYGFTDADLDTPLDLTQLSVRTISGIHSLENPMASLRDLVTFLKKTYCSQIGLEYMHIQDRAKCNWIRSKFEIPEDRFTQKKKYQILERLAFSERFEAFCGNKWNTAKRFGIEGLDSLTPGLKAMIDRSSELGVEHMCFGMPHRGRLNVLANVVRKPMEMIFKEFAGTNFEETDDWSGSGDVKYHLGTHYSRKYDDGRVVHLSMAANPSHLEAVNPVVLGKVKAKMHHLKDPQGKKCMGILLHGDAAFAGQGIVYETMQCAGLPGYSTGGTIHVVMNNQVGFTTDVAHARSTMYASDLGKTFDCPIFHVNADHPEEVCRVFEIASEWRAAFGTDVIVDLIGYRRHGHNELDQPMFTQPVMYKVVNGHPTALSVHVQKLIKSGAFTKVEIDKCIEHVDSVLQAAFDASPAYKISNSQWLASKWATLKQPNQFSHIRKTGVPIEMLRKISAGLTNFPGSFVMHRQVKKVMDSKHESLKAEKGIDWGTAEALAFGVLLQTGMHVRLSGEDVERGTFSHRHCVVNDQETGAKFCPLNHIEGNQAEFHVFNSFLSEFAVLGYDLGYSLENPNYLVIWEAQFGDFANGAQVMIDNFIACGETKWLRQSGLVLLLPHGYDGQGPDHSSCRIERFLQMTDDDEDIVPDMSEGSSMQVQQSNWQIVNCTTPANYFHVLLRQQKRDFRKPLVVIAPKNMLRLRECSSDFEEFSEGTMFRRMLPETFPDELVSPDKVKRVIVCSGKIYYELLAARREKNVNDIAIIRVEQISPFPFDRCAEYLLQYPNAEVAWCQEEPKNMGAWTYCTDRIVTAMNHVGVKTKPKYFGRKAMAASAGGYGSVHAKEQKKIIDAVLSV